MNPRPFAWTVGALLILLGIAGFIPPLAPPEGDPLRIAAGVGGQQLLGLFPTSAVLSGLYVVLGAWGFWAGGRLVHAVRFARLAGLIFLLLLVFGTIPGADTLFGLAPLYGNNLLLHGILAVLLFLFGWLYRHPRLASAAEDEDDL
jgi:hypothetical protein